MVEALRNVGCIVEEIFTYETVCGKLRSDNEIKDVDVIVFTSPSTVKNMIKMVGIETVQSKKALAIGPITEKALLDVGIKATVCDVFNMDGVISKLLLM